MPKFIDYHAKMPQLPPEAVEDMRARVQAGEADGFGVTPLNVFFTTGGQAYCLTEAPNADAVCESHQATGVPLSRENVFEVMSLV